LLQKAGPACGRWFILRLAGIYGQGGIICSSQILGGAAEMAGSGEQRLNLAHRDDIVAAIWAAFMSPAAGGNRFLMWPMTPLPTKSKVVEWLAAQVGRPPPLLRWPGSTRRGFAEPAGPFDQQCPYSRWTGLAAGVSVFRRGLSADPERVGVLTRQPPAQR